MIQEMVADSKNQTLRLRDGRALGYAEYGAQSGKPIFVFLGTTSRLFFPMDETVTAELGARVITVERPGIGLSDFQPGRHLLSWPDDIAQLADTLGLQHFAVLGASGGGPYAAACAYRLSNRVSRLNLIGSLAPFQAPEVRQALTWVYRILPVMASLPTGAMSRIQSWYVRNPEVAWRRFYQRLPEGDKASLRTQPAVDMRTLFYHDYPEVYRRGTLPSVYDTRVLTRPWGFSPADIQAPTSIWQGKKDGSVRLTMAEYLGRTIPNATVRYVADEGRFVYLRHWRGILEQALER